MRIITSILLMLFISTAQASCLVYKNDVPLQEKLHDPLMTILSDEPVCPRSVLSFKALLGSYGLSIHSSMVANRGRNNPVLGSFSFFEWVVGTLSDGSLINAGDFFFGHFTDSEHGTIYFDQQPAKNKLLIELIAWDGVKQMYNFYEMRGLDDKLTRWYYRGDSRDALSDNRYLYRQSPNGAKHFGQRMRCSACHSSGGPIIKELTAPYNDWWQPERHLKLLPNVANDDVSTLMHNLSGADVLSVIAKQGMAKLDSSEKFNLAKHELSLQEQLRPLFCTTEINLQADEGQSDNADVAIPSAFWLNPLLGNVKGVISRRDYKALLLSHEMQFPETSDLDADHAWLTPIKGYSDIKAIKQLIEDGVITRHFAESVLMIDFKQATLSNPRCQLLQYVPAQYSNEWLSDFVANLTTKKDESARLLGQYLTRSKFDHGYYQLMVDDYIHELQTALATVTGQEKAFNKLLELRKAVFDSEISQNPLGQILEPGFRVIFPISKNGSEE